MYLAVLSWNYDSDCSKTMAILPYHLVTACNEAIMAYSLLEEKKEITLDQYKAIEVG